MAYGRFKSTGSLGLFHCIWQLVDHLPFAYVEKQSLSYGRKEVPFATWCFMIKAKGRLSTICQTSVIVSISLSTMCHKSKICNLPYAIYHPSLFQRENDWRLQTEFVDKWLQLGDHIKLMRRIKVDWTRRERGRAKRILLWNCAVASKAIHFPSAT